VGLVAWAGLVVWVGIIDSVPRVLDMAGLGLSAIVGAKLGELAWARFRRADRLAELQDTARLLLADTGWRVEVTPKGTRFACAVVYEATETSGMVCMMAEPSTVEEVRAWFSGLHAGHKLGDFQREESAR
jgi:hypothetical protein